MGIWDRLFGNPIEELKLAQTVTSSRLAMPKPPPVDVSMDSLLRYSRRNELVYACIEKKAQAACDAELVVERKNGDEWERVDGHPLVSLLNKPNPYDDGESFRRAWIASENFADVFYAEIVRSGAGQPVALYPLHPAYIKPEYKSTSKGEELDYYSYKMNGKEVRFAPDELLIRRRHGLGSIYAGISPVMVALGSVDADDALTEYVRAFFNNGGTPSGILNIEGRNLTDDEAAAYQQRWMSKFSRGGKNRAGVAILDKAKATYQTVGSGLNEIESGELREILEARICMPFGVPPIIVGAYTGMKNVTNNATNKQEMVNFWQNTMSPELKSIRSFLTWNLLPMFESIESIQQGKIRVNWDMSQVEALQEDLNERHARAREAFGTGGITLNEFRAMIGMDADANGDYYLRLYTRQPTTPEAAWEIAQVAAVPANIQDVGQIDEEAAKQESDNPKQLSDYQIALKQLLDKSPELRQKIASAFQLNPKPDVLESEIIEPEKKTFELNGLTLSREPSEIEKKIDLKSMVADMETDRQKLSTVLMNLRESLITEAVEIFSEHSDEFNQKGLYELVLTPPKKIYGQIAKILERAFERGSDQVYKELQAQGFDEEITIDLTKSIIQQLTDLTVSRIVNEIQTRAINQIASLGVLNRKIEEIKQELGKILREQSTNWLDSYASSAVNTATQRGRNDTIEQTSEFWEHLEYSAILDLNTCESCEEWDGKTTSSVEDLPDTPNAECDGGDRCRCFIVAVFV